MLYLFSYCQMYIIGLQWYEICMVQKYHSFMLTLTQWNSIQQISTCKCTLYENHGISKPLQL